MLLFKQGESSLLEKTRKVLFPRLWKVDGVYFLLLIIAARSSLLFSANMACIVQSSGGLGRSSQFGSTYGLTQFDLNVWRPCVSWTTTTSTSVYTEVCGPSNNLFFVWHTHTSAPAVKFPIWADDSRPFLFCPCLRQNAILRRACFFPASASSFSTLCALSSCFNDGHFLVRRGIHPNTNNIRHSPSHAMVAFTEKMVSCEQ